MGEAAAEAGSRTSRRRSAAELDVGGKAGGTEEADKLGKAQRVSQTGSTSSQRVSRTGSASSDSGAAAGVLIAPRRAGLGKRLSARLGKFLGRDKPKVWMQDPQAVGQAGMAGNDNMPATPLPEADDAAIATAVGMLRSSNPDMALEAIQQLRRWLSRVADPPIAQVVRANGIPAIAALLRPHGNSDRVVFEAAWALTNICSGDTEYCTAVVEAGVVEQFVQLLGSQNADISEQAAWGLGNIAGDITMSRDRVNRAGGLVGMLELISPQRHPSLSMLRNTVWALSNCVRGRPHVELSVAETAARGLAPVLSSDDNETLTDLLWAFSYISEIEPAGVAVVQLNGFLEHVVRRFLADASNISFTTVIPALRCIGNVVTGDDASTQSAIDAGAIPALAGLCSHARAGIRKEANWALSNIAAGSAAQIEELMASGVLQATADKLRLSPGSEDRESVDVEKEQLWMLSNACSGGTRSQIAVFALEWRFVDALAVHLNERRMPTDVAVEGLRAIADKGADQGDTADLGHRHPYLAAFEPHMQLLESNLTAIQLRALRSSLYPEAEQD